MKATSKMTKVLVGIALLLMGTTGFAADKGRFSVEPKSNNGKKWRIAYIEAGEYIDYQQYLSETVRGLMKLGWIETADIPRQEGEQTKQLWKWLSTKAKSRYLEFLADGHYTGNWDEKAGKQLANGLLKRLQAKKDVNVLIAMGTWAGKEFANNRHNTPVMVVSSSDALSAGVIKSVSDSGYDHVHATLDPGKFERQVRVFHEIVNFKKLGVAYEDTLNGRSYAAVEVLEKLKKEKGFELVRCYTKSDIADTREAEQSVVRCFEQLADKADAIYVTQQGGVDRRSIPALVRIANEHRIPTFSQSGAEEVKYGFLASLSQAGFRYVGEFEARTLAKILNGAKPNHIDQLFEEPPKIALNLKTAELIGFDPPVLLIGAADEIFHEIANPK